VSCSSRVYSEQWSWRRYRHFYQHANNSKLCKRWYCYSWDIRPSVGPSVCLKHSGQYRSM